MTVYSYSKGIFRVIALFGILFLAAGAWEAWTAYRFSQHAETVEGTFKGYYTDEALPMYTYTDAQGRVHDETGREGHFFEHLAYGDTVTVLVATDGSGETRLGDIDSLYGKAILDCVIGLLFLFVINYGIRIFNRYLGPPRQVSETVSYPEQPRPADLIAAYPGQPQQPADALRPAFLFFQKELRALGQSRLPVSGLVVYLGGFFLIGAAVIAFAIHITVKRQDAALIDALRQQRYTAALALARECRGVEGQTAGGETALIVALRQQQPEVARAILNCRFVNANVYTADSKSSAQLAADNGDLQTLKLLLQKGAPAFDLAPGLIHDLIVTGDAGSLRLIFDNGFNLHQQYRRRSFGDYAVIEGQAEIVRLIQSRQGPFDAPEPFIALALNDPAALHNALQKPGADKLSFHGYSLERFAKKINRQDLLSNIRKDK